MNHAGVGGNLTSIVKDRSTPFTLIVASPVLSSLGELGLAGCRKRPAKLGRAGRVELLRIAMLVV